MLGFGVMASADICVVSGRYPASSFDSYVNHRVYCDRHGYTYVYCNWPTRARNPYFNKLEYLRHYYRHFEFLFWIDDDAFFMDLDKSLEQYLPSSDQFLSICASPDYKKIHTYVSSGQFALRCSDVGRTFLDDVTRVDLDAVKRWWQPELGFFSNGDQDAMVYLLRTKPEYADGYVRHHYKLF